MGTGLFDASSHQRCACHAPAPPKNRCTVCAGPPASCHPCPCPPRRAPLAGLPRRLRGHPALVGPCHQALQGTPRALDTVGEAGRWLRRFSMCQGLHTLPPLQTQCVGAAGTQKRASGSQMLCFAHGLDFIKHPTSWTGHAVGTAGHTVRTQRAALTCRHRITTSCTGPRGRRPGVGQGSRVGSTAGGRFAPFCTPAVAALPACCRSCGPCRSSCTQAAGQSAITWCPGWGPATRARTSLVLITCGTKRVSDCTSGFTNAQGHASGEAH